MDTVISAKANFLMQGSDVARGFGIDTPLLHEKEGAIKESITA